MLIQIALSTILLFSANLYTQNSEYDLSQKALESVKISPNSYAQVCYLKMVNFYQLNDLKSANKWYFNLVNGLDNDKVPERYLALAMHIKQDIDLYGKNPLNDIAKDMKKSTNRLTNSKGGPVTQKIQKDIVDKLSKLIKEEEDERDRKQKEQQQQKEESKKIEKPLDDSMPNPVNGDGKIDEKKLKILAENWGSMPEKDRAKAMMEISKDLPPRYREIIENYSKNIAKGNR